MYLDHKVLAKDHMGQLFSQRCCFHKSIFNWRYFTCNKRKVKKCIESKSNTISKQNNSNKKQRGKSMPMYRGWGSPIATGSIGGFSPSNKIPSPSPKWKHVRLEISGVLVNICNVKLPCTNEKIPIEDFLVTVLGWATGAVGLLQAFKESASWVLLSCLCVDSHLHISVFK